MIDKIQCERRVGYDIEPYVIACLSALRDGWIPPERVSEAEYKDIKENKDKYPPELVGYCGYQLSFGSKFFGGYRRDKSNPDQCGISFRSAMKQAPNLWGIEFGVKDYRDLDPIEGAVIYCDPPYRGTTKYTKSKSFDYEYFYSWCIKMAKKNIVLVSEYWMPEGFKEIWSKPVKVGLDSAKIEGLQKIERLFEVI